MNLQFAFLLTLSLPFALASTAAPIFTNVVDDTPTHLLVNIQGGEIEHPLNAPGNGAQHHVLSVPALAHWSIDLDLREQATFPPEEDSLLVSVLTMHPASASWPDGPDFQYLGGLGGLNSPTVGSNGMILVDVCDVTSTHQGLVGTPAALDRVRVEFWARYDVLTVGSPFEAAGLQIRDYELVVEGWHTVDAPEPTTASLFLVACAAALLGRPVLPIRRQG